MTSRDESAIDPAALEGLRTQLYESTGDKRFAALTPDQFAQFCYDVKQSGSYYDLMAALDEALSRPVSARAETLEEAAKPVAWRWRWKYPKPSNGITYTGWAVLDSEFAADHRRSEGAEVEALYALSTPAPSAAPVNGDVVADYQKRVHDWMMACFNDAIAFSIQERNHRFLEEALELVQAQGCTKSEANQLVDYVYDRTVGEPKQEVGGVFVCLAALCTASGIDMVGAGETELARIWTKVEKIRAKHAAKPQFSPLPGSTAAQAEGGS